jgi:hypothetical protein
LVHLARDVRKHVVLATVASVFLAGTGVFAVYEALSQPMRRSSLVAFLVFATAALVTSWLGVITVPRWYRRATRLTLTGPSVPGTVILTLEADADSTSLYGAVSGAASGSEGSDRVALLMPSWDFKPLLGVALSAELYVDPSNSRLMAIATHDGYLWCVPPGTILSFSGAA